MPRAVITVFILLCASALIYSLWPSPETKALMIDESLVPSEPGQHDASIHSVGRDGLQNEAAAQRSEIDPVESEQVRRVLVLDPDGNPVAGELLRYFIGDASLAETQFFKNRLSGENPLKVDSTLSFLNSAITDESGIVALPTEGVLNIGMRTSIWQGARVAGLFDPDDESPIVLQLAPFECIEVYVVTSEGDPAEGVSVGFFRSTAESRALVESSQSQSSDNSSWRYKLEAITALRPTDASGVVRFDATLPIDLVQKHQLEAEVTQTFAIAELPFGVRADQEFELGTAARIELQLPPLGGVRVELVDYPSTIIPGLDPFNYRGTSVVGPSDSDLIHSHDNSRTYSFGNIPLGMEFEVRLYREIVEGQMRWSRSTKSPGRSTLGPASPKEWKDVRLVFDRSEAVVGSLVNAQGEFVVPQLKSGFQLTLLGVTADHSKGPIELPVELDLDGSFTASLPNPNPRQLAWRDFNELCLVQTPFQRLFVSASDSKMAKRELTWTRFDLPLATQSQPIEVGTLTLGQERPALTIEVVDAETGEGIPKVRLEIERSYSRVAESGLNWKDAHICELMSPETSEFGVFLVPEAQQLNFLDLLRSDRAEMTERCRISTSHKDYLGFEQEFSVRDSALKIRLQRAHTLEGKVIAPRNLEAVLMGMVPSGVDPEATRRMSGRTALNFKFAEELEDGSKVLDFKMRSLKAGLQDLVFSSGLDREYTRVANIDPALTSELASTIDLRGLIKFARIALIDRDGNRWVESGPQIDIHETAARASGSSRAVWDDGWIALPLPAAGEFIGFLKAPGYRSVTLSDFAAGDHVVQLGPMREVRLRYTLSQELPEGANLSAEWFAVDPPDPVTFLDPLGDEDLRMTMGAATQFRIRWWLRDDEGKRLGLQTDQIQLTEAMLETGEIIDIPVPEDLFRQ